MSAISCLLRPARQPYPAQTRRRHAIDVRRLWRRLFDPYRPELHYMRGPGPKWRAKHGHTSVTLASHRPKRRPAD